MPTTETTNGTPKSPIKVACCMPKQHYTLADKLSWLDESLVATDCHLFLTSQEYFGGHYISTRSKSDMPLHILRDWIVEEVGGLAKKHKKCIGVGACVKTEKVGATEDYLYLDSNGELLGWHTKFALPSYDDMRTGGHGQLWPETNYGRRVTPIDIPELRLRVGTVFCWEVFSQTIFSAYSFAGVNLVVHPIKFAPRGWLNNKKKSDGMLHIVGFGNAPKSNIWLDRLIFASRHQCLCPIAISCNSWDLGASYMALTGHVDELRKNTNMVDVPALGRLQKIHVFSMLPEFYSGLDHHHSGGAFVAHTGSIEGYSELGEFTMTAKIRRLEAQLIGNTTRLDCQLKEATLRRQKSSTIKRGLGTSVQKVQAPKPKRT